MLQEPFRPDIGWYDKIWFNADNDFFSAIIKERKLKEDYVI